MGDIKFGRLVGEDQFGNKYYEDPTEVHGQHRWVEYPHTWDEFDASQIPADWHAWMHHTTDVPPNSPLAKVLHIVIEKIVFVCKK